MILDDKEKKKEKMKERERVEFTKELLYKLHLPPLIK